MTVPTLLLLALPKSALFPTGILGLPGGSEWIVILVIALLLFGRRLPEVMRSMGRGVVEFKKGIKGVEDEIEMESNRPTIQPPTGETASSEKEEE
jgi:sec-independent protein translocase protein TatA